MCWMGCRLWRQCFTCFFSDICFCHWLTTWSLCSSVSTCRHNQSEQKEKRRRAILNQEVCVVLFPRNHENFATFRSSGLFFLRCSLSNSSANWELKADVGCCYDPKAEHCFLGVKETHPTFFLRSSRAVRSSSLFCRSCPLSVFLSGTNCLSSASSRLFSSWSKVLSPFLRCSKLASCSSFRYCLR